jgi:uncharacterized protein YbjT (DUF2867 family)
MGNWTILVLCADCDTGYRLVQLALQSDHHVVAAIRHYTDGSRYERMGADVIKVDPTRQQDVAAMFANMNPQGVAITCVLGGTPQLNSQGNINVINAAEEIGIRRFLLVTSIGCGDSADAVDEIVKAFAGKALTAKTWAERQLQSTDMDWTIIRAGSIFRRNFNGGGILLESRTVSGLINADELGDVVFQALLSPRTKKKILAAVDADEAYEISGVPVVAAEI